MKRILVLLCVLLAIGIACGLVEAYSETFELPAKDVCTRDVSLNADDRVSGHVTIVGSPINFSISDPDDEIIQSITFTEPLDFQFTAEKAGTYKLHFENWYSEDIKFVTLNYNVQHYIFGFPQEFIILFVIVGFALVAIVVFVAMSPKP
jgi:hypothetical protein